MDAAFLIPTFNRPADLSRTLDHLLPLLDAQLGLILVDDASTDPLHRALLDRVSADHPYVRVVRLAASHGCTGARRVVLDTLDVPFVIMLDDDSHFVDATRADLETVLDRFRADPSIGAQGFACFEPSRDESLDVALNRVYDGRMVSGFINCACAVRMAAYRDIGGYAEAFTSPYGEERDLCIRLMDRGWTVRQFVNPPVVHYQSLTVRNKEHNARGSALNYLRFIWWYHPTWMAVPYSVTTVAKLFVNGIRRRHSLRGLWLGTVDFFREAARGLPRRRVRIQTLKAFYSLKRRVTMTDDALHALQERSWMRVFTEVFAGASAQEEEDEARSLRLWSRNPTHHTPFDDVLDERARS